MTPAERQLVTELFDRLATLEDAQRDPDAERAIRDGLAQAPNAVYALVQTALVQDEALKSAHARIQELEASSEPATRTAPGRLPRQRARQHLGPAGRPRGSVPNVRPGDAPMGAPPGFGGPAHGGPYQGQPMGGPGLRTARSDAAAEPSHRAAAARSSAPRRQPPPAPSAVRC